MDIQSEEEPRGTAGMGEGSGMGKEAAARNNFWTAVGLVVIAAGLVALVIQTSFRLGRLAGVPLPDDVGMFGYSAMMVRAFYEGGMGGVAQFYIHQPPHSPYTVLLIGLSYMLFGIHEWSPYVMNVFQIGAVLGLVYWLTRGMSVAVRVLLMVFTAAVPIFSASIAESKGDYATGFALATAAVVMTSGPFWTLRGQEGLKPHLVVGLLFALALWTKPSLFAPTILMTIGTLGVTFLADWIVDRRFPPIRRAACGLGCVVGMMVLLNGPHFYLAGRHLWNYMMIHNFGEHKDKWVYRGDVWHHAWYYLTGDGGRMMVGKFLYVLAAAIITAGVVMAVRRRRAELVRYGALMCVMGAAYLMPTVNAVKSVLFGLGFHSVITLAGVAAIVYLIREMRGAGRLKWAPPVVAGALVVLAVGFYRPTYAWYPFSKSVTATARRPLDDQRVMIDAFADEIVKDARNGNVRVTLISGSGDLSYSLLMMRAVREGVDFSVTAIHGKNGEDYIPLIDYADIVIAAEPGTCMQLDLFEEPKVHQEALEVIRSRPDFVETMRMRAPLTDSYFYMFKRRERVWDGFEGIRPLSGMLKLEGPYKQWQTPRIRWAVKPGTELEPMVGPGSYKLRMMCLTHSENQVMTVKLDGKEIGRLEFKGPHQWQPLEVPVEIGAGPHRVMLEYTQAKADPDAARAVLFRGLSLVPADRAR